MKNFISSGGRINQRDTGAEFVDADAGYFAVSVSAAAGDFCVSECVFNAVFRQAVDDRWRGAGSA